MAQASNLLGTKVYLTTDQTVTTVSGLTPIKLSNLSGYDSKSNSFVTYYDISDVQGYSKKVCTVSDCKQVQVSVPAEEAGDLTIFDTIDANSGHEGRIFVTFSPSAQIKLGKTGCYANVILIDKNPNDANENGYTGAQFTFEVSGAWTSMGSPSTSTSTPI